MTHSTILISTWFIHTAPVEDESKAYFLWHVEIIPRLTTPAGFELGSEIPGQSLRAGRSRAVFLRGAGDS
jgi:hypothetical protein